MSLCAPIRLHAVRRCHFQFFVTPLTVTRLPRAGLSSTDLTQKIGRSPSVVPSCIFGKHSVGLVITGSSPQCVLHECSVISVCPMIFNDTVGRQKGRMNWNHFQHRVLSEVPGWKVPRRMSPLGA